MHLIRLFAIVSVVVAQGPLFHVSPFFFLCNYHGNVQELGKQTGEVKLSVSIQGNPDTYVPGNFYPGTAFLFACISWLLLC